MLLIMLLPLRVKGALQHMQGAAEVQPCQNRQGSHYQELIACDSDVITIWTYIITALMSLMRLERLQGRRWRARALQHVREAPQGDARQDRLPHALRRVQEAERGLRVPWRRWPEQRARRRQRHGIPGQLTRQAAAPVSCRPHAAACCSTASWTPQQTQPLTYRQPYWLCSHLTPLCAFQRQFIYYCNMLSQIEWGNASVYCMQGHRIPRHVHAWRQGQAWQ